MRQLSPDEAKMREYIYSLLDIASARAVLDIGCGDGYDLQQIGRLAGPDTRLFGLDSMPKAIEAARAEMQADSRLSFSVADVSLGLPFDDGEFDILYSNNMLECVTDKDALIKEVHRVLRDDGQAVFAHFDWDSQLVDGIDKALVRKIVHAFADWQQDWMADADPWMGRRLWRTFNRSGLFEGRVHAYVLTNTEYSPANYGYGRIHDFAAMARRGLIQEEECDALHRDIAVLAGKGEYFYSITMYIYVGRKIKPYTGSRR